VIEVMEQCDDGWYVGLNQRSTEFGTFPGNYVEKVCWSVVAVVVVVVLHVVVVLLLGLLLPLVVVATAAVLWIALYN